MTLRALLQGHLNENHMRYFRFWNQMIDLDSREARQRQSRIWTETSATCQAHGRCVSNVCLDSEQVRFIRDVPGWQSL